MNDSFGHLTGDKVLQVFSNLVHKNKRTTDIFGRWGGEEFLLIFPETNKQHAFIAADKIRQRLEKQFFEEGIRQTVSVGVVEAHPNITVKEMLSLADKNLYLAKEAGRNQVVY